MTQQPGHTVLNTLKRYRKLLAAEHLRIGLLISLGLGFLLLALTITAESVWYLSPGTREMFLWITGGVVAFGLFSSGLWVGIIGAGAVPGFSDVTLARRLGREFPTLGDRVVNALSLLRKQERYGYSENLIRRNLQDVSSDLSGIRLEEAVSTRTRSRVLTAIGGMVGFWIIVWLPFAGSVLEGINRTAHPNQEFPIPQPFTLQISPGNAEILNNEPVTVTARVNGDQPEEVLLTTVEPNDERTIRLTADSANRYQYTFRDVRKSFQYYVHAESPHWWDRWDEIRSQTYNVNVLSRPRIQSLAITLVPPDYSGLPKRRQEITSTEIAVLKGTEVQLQARANKPVASAGLYFVSRDTTLPMDVSSTSIQSVFTAMGNSEVEIHLKDHQGVSNHDPARYRISTLHDEHPRVEILQPGGDVNLGESMQIPLVLRLQDDYGFSKLAVQYQIDKPAAMDRDSSWKEVELPLDQPDQRALDYNHTWNLNTLNLSPRDVVNYRAALWDNDAVSGPKVAHSQIRTARFPSLSDMYSQVNRQQSASMDQAQEIREQVKRIKEQVDKLALEMRKKEEVTWQQKKQSEQVIQSHDELKKKLDEISRQLDTMMEEAQKHQLFSENVMQKYQELQKLFQDVMTPELEEALKRLQKALDSADPEQVRKAMEELQQSEQNLSQNLDRALELFKRVKIEQQMDEVVKRINDLVKRQEEIAGKADSAGTDPSSLSQEEQLAADEYELSEQKMEELSKLMEEFPILPADQMQEALQQAKNDSIRQKMRNAQQQFRQGNMPQGKQQAQQSKEALQQLASQLRRTRESVRNKMMQEIMAEFRSVLKSVLSISQQQEALHTKTAPLGGKSPRLGSLADEQQTIQMNLQRVVSQLVNLSHKTFGITSEIGKSLGQSASNMQKSVQQLTQRRTNQAAQHQSAAMASLNRTAQQLLNSMQSMQSQGSSTGFEEYLKRMKQISQQQQGINQKSQKQLGLQGRPTAARQKALQQLAAEQRAARQALQQLQQQMQQSGGKQGLGDLGKISEDMGEVEKDLRQEKFTRETIERQQKILTRLLDAQKSMRTRDYSKKREAEVGEDITRSGPSGLPADFGERRNLLQESLDQALREGYSRTYEQVIRDYFNSLSQEETLTGSGGGTDE